MPKTQLSSLPNKEGIKFVCKKRLWIVTKPVVATYSGILVDREGTQISENSIVFILPLDVKLQDMRLSLVDVELSGEILLVDKDGNGYADQFEYPANFRTNSSDDIP